MKKTFSKTKILSLILCLAMMITALAVGLHSIDRSVYAAEERTNIVKDNFDDPNKRNSYDVMNWVESGDSGNTFKQTTPYNDDVVFVGQAGADPALNNIRTSDKFYGIKSVQYDVNFYKESIPGAWMCMTFVQGDEGYDYQVPNLINSSTIGGYSRSNSYGRGKVIVSEEFADKPSEYRPDDPYSVKTANIGKYLNGTNGDVMNQWITIKFVIVEERQADKYAAFDVYMWYRGDSMPATPICRTTVEVGGDMKSTSIVDGVQLRFIWNNNVYMDNVIVDAEKRVSPRGVETVLTEPAVDTFTNGLGAADGLFVISKSSFNTYVYGLGHYEMTDGKQFARIIANYSVAEDKSTLTDFDVINANFKAKVESGKSAFVFGVKNVTAAVREGAYAVELCKTTDGAEVQVVKYSADGAETVRELMGTLPAYAVGNGWADINIIVNKNGNVTVYENGVNLGTVSGIEKYYGSCGLMVAEEGSNAGFDDVNIKSFVYNIPYTKSVSTDFSNDYLGAPARADFLHGLSNPATFFIGDGELNYKGAIKDDYIAGNYEYDEFVVEYKITSILSQCTHNAACSCADSTPYANWIGLDFGRNSASSKLGDYCTIGFYTARRADAKPAFVKGNTAAMQDGTTSVEFGEEIHTLTATAIPYELFAGVTYDGVKTQKEDISASNYLCVKWVGDGDSLKLYMKKAGELEYTLYATVGGIQTAGYVALVNYNTTFLTIDDLAITNMSPIYNVPANNYPSKIYLEKDEEYNPNEYGNAGTLDQELEYLNNLQVVESEGGCGSNIASAVAIPSIILSVIALATIAVRRRKHEESNN